jgi:hypothetical protein
LQLPIAIVVWRTLHIFVNEGAVISRHSKWLVIAAAGLAAFLYTGCARASAPTTEPRAEHTEPPRMLTRGFFPELTLSNLPNPADRPIVRLRIRVMIDPLGRADVRTLKLTGLGAVENRLAIERWLEAVTFRPAMRNGQPVSGLYETRLEVRVSVRRL